MIIVSNHLLKTTHLPIPSDVVVRVNIAWIKTKAELVKLLGEIDHDIYLDYPQGRSKPPRPTLGLDDALEIAQQFPKVKYFAVSNAESALTMEEIKKQLPSHVELVPKIETHFGIDNLREIVVGAKTKYIMLDKEDLYIDVNRDSEVFDHLIELTREKGRELKIQVLELQGVVFAPHK